MTRSILRWASAKLGSVFYDVIMQKRVLSSDEYFSIILPKIFVLGSDKPYEVTIFTFPYTNFADNKAFNAVSLILAFKWYE